MAAPLSILISDPNGCLTLQIFGITVVSGQALQKPGMKSCGVCALGCSAFRGSDRFTVTNSVQEGRGISLSRRDLPVISALLAIRQGHLVDVTMYRTETKSARFDDALLSERSDIPGRKVCGTMRVIA
jgi:hypothetical protein